FVAGLSTVLGRADGHNAVVARQRVWSALVADATPYNFGAAAHVPPAVGQLRRERVDDVIVADVAIEHLDRVPVAV
ncbi:hypothetical protein C6A85_14855, partial [Mycobacterium sp. ITM-2017-0098]